MGTPYLARPTAGRVLPHRASFSLRYIVYPSPLSKKETDSDKSKEKSQRRKAIDGIPESMKDASYSPETPLLIVISVKRNVFFYNSCSKKRATIA
jgi:hypothetical protein